MATRIFDRDTILDLTVNIIPLGIIAFFVVGFAVFNPFGVDPLASGIQYGLLIAPFAALAVLTYLSGKAIAGAEKSAPVYIPGQATVEGETPVEGHGEAEGELAAGGELDAGARAVEDGDENEDADEDAVAEADEQAA